MTTPTSGQVHPRDTASRLELEVVRARPLGGPNRWRRAAVVTADVEPGALLDDAGAYAAVRAALRPHVPALAAGRADGPGWARVVADVAVALQVEAGSDLAGDADWRLVADGEEQGAWTIAIGLEDEEVALAALRAAARVVRAAAAGEALDWEDEVAWLGRLLARERLPAPVAALVAAARARGIPVRRLFDEPVVRLGLGARSRRVAIDDRAPSLDALFPAGEDGRIPVVAVTGTNGKTTTTRLVAHLLRTAGKRTGFTTTDGVYFEDAMTFEGDMTGPMAADMVLSDPRVEAAVLETARGGILRAGLAYSDVDVGVVLNVTPDHLGLRGIHTVEQLAGVKAVIVDAVRDDGHVVLNADDPLVWAMRERTRARVVAFTLHARAASAIVAAHVAAGGMAVTVEPDGGDALVLHRGAERTVLLAAAEVPLTEGGAARFQLQNAAAATAAAWAVGVTPDALRAGLRSFVPSHETTPGRMNTVQVRGARVIVDYAHNLAAIGALLDYGRRLDATRRIAVLHSPGDRRDDDLRGVGALAAELDHVVFMENPHYMRGRAPGGSHALLRDGYLSAGGDASRMVLVEGQPAAVDAVLALIEPGALVLFVADDAREVIALLCG